MLSDYTSLNWLEYGALNQYISYKRYIYLTVVVDSTELAGPTPCSRKPFSTKVTVTCNS